MLSWSHGSGGSESGSNLKDGYASWTKRGTPVTTVVIGGKILNRKSKVSAGRPRDWRGVRKRKASGWSGSVTSGTVLEGSLERTPAILGGEQSLLHCMEHS